MSHTGHDYAREAASYEGVRYKTYGRSRQTGLDCFGLVLAPAWGLGIDLPDFRDYDPRCPDPSVVLSRCREHLLEVPFEDAGAGCIAVSQWDNQLAGARHLSVLLPGERMVHVDAIRRRVTRVPAGWLEGKLRGVFRIPALEYGGSW